MKPIEFIVYKSDGSNWYIKFFYDNGTTHDIIIDEKPDGIEQNKRYSIEKN